ncbi:MAG: class I SAM-dependent methyltransferase [Anaerolineae bacterium]
MPHPDASRWDERYRQNPEQWLRRPPHQLLRAFAHLLPSRGLALDVAAGTAANGLFLAERGLCVIALDISLTGLRLAQQRARQASLPLSLAVMDLSSPWLPDHHFDVILNFYFLSRPLLQRYHQALKPGGLLFFETYLKDPLHTSEHYLESGELHRAFAAWEILYSQEGPRRGHREADTTRRIAQLVACKPL